MNLTIATTIPTGWKRAKARYVAVALGLTMSVVAGAAIVAATASPAAPSMTRSAAVQPQFASVEDAEFASNAAVNLSPAVRPQFASIEDAANADVDAAQNIVSAAFLRQSAGTSGVGITPMFGTDADAADASLDVARELGAR